MTENIPSETYSVIVTGKIAEGFELNQVKANVGRLFKLGDAQIEKLFCGKPVALQRGLEKQQALKMRVNLMKAGAVVSVKVARAAAAKSAASTTSAKTNFSPDIECPRCGHEQAYVEKCGVCSTDLQLHLLRLKRKEKIRDFRRKNVG